MTSLLTLPNVNTYPKSGLKIDITRTVINNTIIQEATSGKELRANLWSYPRYRFELNFEFLRSASNTNNATLKEYEAIIGFLQAKAGNYDTFLFDCPDDNTATDMRFGTGNGSTTQFQLQRSLLPSTFWSNPPILWPYVGDGFEPVFYTNGTPTIKVNGSTVTPTSISSTGLVTLSSAPANNVPITWSGSYYWKVRVEESEYEFTRIFNGIWELSEISLITVK